MFHIAVPLNKWVYGHRFFEVIPCSTNLGQPPGRPSNKNGGWFSIYLYIINITTTAPPSVSIFPMWVGLGTCFTPYLCKKKGIQKMFQLSKVSLNTTNRWIKSTISPIFHPFFQIFWCHIFRQSTPAWWPKVPLSLPPPEGEPVVLVDRSAIVAELKDLLPGRGSPFFWGRDLTTNNHDKIYIFIYSVLFFSVWLDLDLEC